MVEAHNKAKENQIVH